MKGADQRKDGQIDVMVRTWSLLLRIIQRCQISSINSEKKMVLLVGCRLGPRIWTDPSNATVQKSDCFEQGKGHPVARVS